MKNKLQKIDKSQTIGGICKKIGQSYEDSEILLHKDSSMTITEAKQLIGKSVLKVESLRHEIIIVFHDGTRLSIKGYGLDRGADSLDVDIELKTINL